MSAFRAYVTPPAASVWLRQAVEAERGRFMPWLAVTMIAGDLGYFALLREPDAYAGPALLGVAVALSLLLRSQASARMAAFALLAARNWLRLSPMGPPAAPRRRWRCHALPWCSPPPSPPSNRARRGSRLTLADAHWEGTTLRRALHIRLRLDDPASLATGDTVQLRAVLRPPAPPAYPGGWDLQRDAFFSGLGGRRRRPRPGCHSLASTTRRPGALAHCVAERLIASRLLAGLPGRRGAHWPPLSSRARAAAHPPGRPRRPSATRGWRISWPLPACISASSWAW